MKYRVIVDFTDLEDKNHIYRIGDAYPRSGKRKKERIEALLSADNKRSEPLIMALADKEVKSDGQ
ncbi:hypothetical protein EP56_05735 [Listeriaceae bacterium FSL A5-0209]|nr:hypothetical protein EP56_05735 [Listeriaceae bacterium FSL A5-0209]